MYLLDTNVVFELRKVKAGKADANVAAWNDTVAVAILFLSAITVHELELGVLLKERTDTPQGAMLRAWLNDHVWPAFAGRVLAVDAAVALRARRNCMYLTLVLKRTHSSRRRRWFTV